MGYSQLVLSCITPVHDSLFMKTSSNYLGQNILGHVRSVNTYEFFLTGVWTF